MSGFREYFKNEKRNNTLNFFNKLLSSIFNKYLWNNIIKWCFFIGGIYMLYITLTFKNKKIISCEEVVSFKVNYKMNSVDTLSCYLITNNKDGLNEIEVDKYIFLDYKKLSKTQPILKYYHSYINNIFIFYIILTVVLFILCLIFLLI